MKIKLKDIVHLIILDHGMGTAPIEGRLEFDIYGKVIEIDKEYITLSWWIASNGEIDHNTEVVKIVRNAIVKAKRLR